MLINVSNRGPMSVSKISDGYVFSNFEDLKQRLISDEKNKTFWLTDERTNPVSIKDLEKKYGVQVKTVKKEDLFKGSEIDKETLRLIPGSGGLSTALRHISQCAGEVEYVFWPGEYLTTEQLKVTTEKLAEKGFKSTLVNVEKKLFDDYYTLTNQLLWLGQHGLFDVSNPTEAEIKTWWAAYQRVNQLFAQALCQRTVKNHPVITHDFQLYLVAQIAKQNGYQGTCGFFLHTPCPTSDEFEKFPYQKELLKAALSHDLFCTQRKSDKQNFLEIVKKTFGEPFTQKDADNYMLNGQAIRITDLLIGTASEIKFKMDENIISKYDVMRKDGSQVIFSMQRSDFTKAALLQLQAFREARRQNQKLKMYLVIQPSRTSVPEFATLQSSYQLLVDEINKEFPSAIDYNAQGLDDQDTICSAFQCADITFVPPYRDGCNLVVKEAVIQGKNSDNEAVLILSRGVGASDHLPGAISTDLYPVSDLNYKKGGQYESEKGNTHPTDEDKKLITNVNNLVDTLKSAIQMNPAERKARGEMNRLRCKAFDIENWAQNLLDLLKCVETKQEYKKILNSHGKILQDLVANYQRYPNPIPLEIFVRQTFKEVYGSALTAAEENFERTSKSASPAETSSMDGFEKGDAGSPFEDRRRVELHGSLFLRSPDQSPNSRGRSTSTPSPLTPKRVHEIKDF